MTERERRDGWHKSPWQSEVNRNLATGNAHVDAQISHIDTLIYNQPEQETPEKSQLRARSLLKRGVWREAEEILHELSLSNRHLPDLPYDYVLSILSGRTPSELGKETYERLAQAKTLPREMLGTQTAPVFDLLLEIVPQVLRQARNNNQEEEPEFIRKIEQLPADYRETINAYLDPLISSIRGDRQEREQAKWVADARMNADRERRAWKFFEPPPVRPKVVVAQRGPLDEMTIPQLCWGMVILIAGCASVIPGVNAGNLTLAASGLPIFICGCIIGTYAQGKRTYRRKRRATHQRWFAERTQPLELKSPGHWVRTDFVRKVHKRCDHHFYFNSRFHSKHDGHYSDKEIRRWDADTSGARDSLKNRFVKLYGNANLKNPWSVSWLIEWHAKRVKAQWLSGTLFDFQERFAPRTSDTAWLFAGIALGSLGALSIAFSGWWFLAAGASIGVSGSLLSIAIADFLSRRWIYHDEQDENDELHTEETLGYEERVELLSDRPKDHEMAKWLNLDKRYLKYEALRRCGLAGRELFNELIMTQRDDRALRRWDGGPVRYSRYIVMVFLLTASGVREVETKLDFLNGYSYDEQRTSFAYSSVTSARVTEVGRRLEQEGALVARGEQPVQLGRRAFHLTLSSGEEIEVIAEDFRGLADIDREPPEKLAKLALDSSGITGALHTMESVAAEGQAWVARETERRQQQLRDWEGTGQQETDIGTERLPPANGTTGTYIAKT
ncbi:hypothetical protein [Sciscionella marina]|uniref:hypothetical protein n=1 Tax=Sciscionella marina TaxID=508770 RepID=UPI0003A00706|nr:hypothetical protein [Sciscionella marina]